jgi:hypothetical protein
MSIYRCEFAYALENAHFLADANSSLNFTGQQLICSHVFAPNVKPTLRLGLFIGAERNCLRILLPLNLQPRLKSH